MSQNAPYYASGSTQQTLSADIDLFEVISGVWARKLTVLFGAFVGLMLAIAYIVVTPPKYESEVRILVDRTESEFTRPLDREQSQTEQLLYDQEAVASQVQILLARDLALEVGQRLNLSENPEFSSGGGLLSKLLGGGDARSKEESFLDAYFERLVVYPISESRVISILFKSEDPDLAAKVANTLAEVYRETQSKAKVGDTERAEEWLEQQINVLRSKVAESEAKVQNFRSKNGLFDGRENQSLDAQSLGELTTELIKAKAERSEAQAKSDLIRAMVKQGKDLETIGDVSSSQLIQRLVEQRVGLRTQISELSSTLGPRHPRILELNAELSDLSAQLKSEALKIAQSLENAARLAGAREQALAQSMDTQKTEASLSESQKIELRALEREAESQRELLKVYLTRFSEAAARQGPETTTANARVISSAHPALEPSSPKKAGTIVLGTFAGFLVGFLIAMTKATINALSVREPIANYGTEPVLSTAQAPNPSPDFTPPPPPNRGGRAPLGGFSANNQNFAPLSQVQPVMNASALSQQLLQNQQMFGFARLLCVHPAQQSILPRQVARSVARSGLTTLLVETAPAAGRAGLSEALEGRVGLAQAIIKDKLSAAHIIQGGVSGLTQQGAGRFEAALQALQQSYDCVLIATPAHLVTEHLLSLSPDVCLMGLPQNEAQRYAPFCERVFVLGEAGNAGMGFVPQTYPLGA